MKVLFDLLSAQPQQLGGSKFHGGGEYIKRVFLCMIEEFANAAVFEVYFDKAKYLDDWLLHLIDEKEIRVYDVKSRNEVQGLLDKGGYDVFYSGIPYDYNFLHFPKGTRSVGTIHGLRTIEKLTDRYEIKYETGKTKVNALKSKFFSDIRIARAKTYFAKTIGAFDAFICVSNHTKYSIRNYFPQENPEKFRVFYTPSKYVETADTEKYRKKIGQLGRYILMVGTNRWIKNGFRGIQALDSLFAEGQLAGMRAVLVGGLPAGIKKAIKTKNRFIVLDYLEADALEVLYQNCDFLLYPSLNEGFGMPPVEVMKYGKTCIVSGVCSIPEVCGNAVYYVNPYDVPEIRNRILMASECKLPEEQVKNRFREIYERQEKDLRGACAYILGIQ